MKKVILITGCSSGLGLVLAKKLSRNHIVYASMRNPVDVKKFQKDSTQHFIPIRLDVTESESIEQVLKVIQGQHQRLDVLINNAGMMHMGFFEDVPEKAFRELFETNFFGMVSLTKRALFLLKSSSCAKIINISSSSGILAMPALTTYSASKWAVEGFSESLRLELNSLGIQVVLIEPGLIRTELLDKNLNIIANPESDSAPRMKIITDKWNKMNPQKFLDPKDVCKVIEKRIAQKNPPFRTLISHLSKLKLFMKRAFPFSWYEKILLKVLKI